MKALLMALVMLGGAFVGYSASVSVESSSGSAACTLDGAVTASTDGSAPATDAAPPSCSTSGLD